MKPFGKIIALFAILTLQSFSFAKTQYSYRSSSFNMDKIQTALEELRSVIPLKEAETESESDLELLKTNAPDSLKEEYQKNSFYKIQIKNGKTTVYAEEEQGMFYGMSHLRELVLLEKHENDTLIEEYPKMFFRGIADDISRGQISTMDNFKKIIRFCGLNRMNFYFFYLEDVLSLKSYPNFAKNTSPLTASEIKELEEFATRYFVEIVPIFQTLGHQENILLREEFLPYAEYPGAASFRVGDEKVMEFLEKSLKEVAEMFSSPYLHIGADESWDVGFGEGRKNGDEKEIEKLHLDHYRKVFKIVEKLDKKVIMYSDMLLDYPDILPDLPEDVTVMLWLYHVPEYYESAMTFAKADRPYIVSHAVWNWNRPYPDNIMAKENIYRLTRDGFVNKSIGSLVSSWGDYGSPNFRDMNFYGYAWAARCAWDPINADIDRFDAEFWPLFLEDGNLGQKARVVHEVLSQAGTLLTFQTFFRHPYYKIDFADLNKKIILSEKLRRLSNTALAELREGAGHPYFEFFKFSTDLFKLYSKQLNILIDYHQTKKYPTPYNNSEIANRLKEAARETAALKKEFSRLWLKNYRKNKLDLLEKEFDYSIFFLNRTAEEIAAGVEPDGEIPGRFITFPETESLSRKTIYVRQDIHIDKTVKNAKIQIIAAGNAKVWINGKEAGEVFAQPCLSLLVKRARVRVFDAGKYLKKGLNKIAVKGEFHRKETSAVHCFLTYQTEDNQIHDVFTDENWKVSVKKQDDWRTQAPENENWKAGVPFKYSEIVTKPYLWEGVPSIIQDWR